MNTFAIRTTFAGAIMTAPSLVSAHGGHDTEAPLLHLLSSPDHVTVLSLTVLACLALLVRPASSRRRARRVNKD